MGGRRLKDLLLELAASIPIVSAFAYFCAYIYEINFCNYFGIPPNLISISWTHFLIYIPLTVAIIPVIFVTVWANSENIAHNCIFGFLLTLVLLAFSKFTTAITSWDIYLVFTLVFAIMFAYLFISKYRMQNVRDNNSKYKEALERRLIELLNHLGCALLIVIAVAFLLLLIFKPFVFLIKKTRSSMKRVGVSKHIRITCIKIVGLFKLLGWARFWKCVEIIVILLLFVYFGWSSADTGEKDAKNGTLYYIQSVPQNPSVASLSIEELYNRNQNSQNLSEQNLVVLRIYGDKAICAPWYIDESGQYTTKEFVILPLENITLTPMQIGPLHVTTK